MDHLTPLNNLLSKHYVVRLDVSLDLSIDLDFSLFPEDEPQAKIISTSDDLLPTLTSILSSIYGTVSDMVTFTRTLELPRANLSADSFSLNKSSSSVNKETPFEPETSSPINFASNFGQLIQEEEETISPLQNRIDALPTDFPIQARSFLQLCPLTLSEEGVGGTYFLEDFDGEYFAVFKPVDEEPGAPNNPKKLVTDPLLPPGGGALREAAAYLLDRGFAGVPPTYFLSNIQTTNGIKSGSVQKFIKNDGESSSVGSSSFLPDDVHKIGLLDIRLFNMDRNGENILIKKEGNQHRLIPIDHSYTLPESLDGAFFDWMFWKQAKIPFSNETISFVESIDVDEDAKVLRELGISEGGIKTMVVASLLMKHCVQIGKNLFQIAEFICRDFSGAPSKLEELVSAADASDFYGSFKDLLKTQIV